jgi:hypothetical protein
MKPFALLKTKDIISLVGLILIGFAWILVDQFFIKQSSHRFIAFAIVLIVLFYLLFFINKPLHVWHYANTFASILVIFVILCSVVMHVIIKHDFNQYVGHSLMLWCMIAALPYLAGFIYKLTRK